MEFYELFALNLFYFYFTSFFSWEDVQLNSITCSELSFHFVLVADYPFGESFCLTQRRYDNIQPSGGFIGRVHCLGGGGTPRI